MKRSFSSPPPHKGWYFCIYLRHLKSWSHNWVGDKLNKTILGRGGLASRKEEGTQAAKWHWSSMCTHTDRAAKPKHLKLLFPNPADHFWHRPRKQRQYFSSQRYPAKRTNGKITFCVGLPQASSILHFSQRRTEICGEVCPTEIMDYNNQHWKRMG